MNLLDIHETVKKENAILKLKCKLQKIKDPKEKDKMIAEIIKMNGRINVKELGRIG